MKTVNKITISISINNQEALIKSDLFIEPLTKEEVGIVLDNGISISQEVQYIIEALLESVPKEDLFELIVFHPEITS